MQCIYAFGSVSGNENKHSFTRQVPDLVINWIKKFYQWFHSEVTCNFLEMFASVFWGCGGMQTFRLLRRERFVTVFRGENASGKLLSLHLLTVCGEWSWAWMCLENWIMKKWKEEGVFVVCVAMAFSQSRFTLSEPQGVSTWTRFWKIKKCGHVKGPGRLLLFAAKQSLETGLDICNRPFNGGVFTGRLVYQCLPTQEPQSIIDVFVLNTLK